MRTWRFRQTERRRTGPGRLSFPSRRSKSRPTMTGRKRPNPPSRTTGESLDRRAPVVAVYNRCFAVAVQQRKRHVVMGKQSQWYCQAKSYHWITRMNDVLGGDEGCFDEPHPRRRSYAGRCQSSLSSSCLVGGQWCNYLSSDQKRAGNRNQRSLDFAISRSSPQTRQQLLQDGDPQLTEQQQGHLEGWFSDASFSPSFKL